MENNQTTDIIIDDGKQTYNIKNQNGELLGSFRMNPADMSILERFKSVENVLENITEHVDMNKDFEEVEKEMSAIVREQINYLFDCDCADVLFGITSPFTIMKNGEFFLEQVINVIGTAVNADLKHRSTKIDEKIGKYTKKYHG